MEQNPLDILADSFNLNEIKGEIEVYDGPMTDKPASEVERYMSQLGNAHARLADTVKELKSRLTLVTGQEPTMSKATDEDVSSATSPLGQFLRDEARKAETLEDSLVELISLLKI